jgi:hypothetical protein
MPPELEADYLDALDLLTSDPDSPTLQGVGSEDRQAMTTARPWIAGPTVVGNGMTFKRVNGMAVEAQLALVVYVSEKLPDTALDPSERVPPEVAVPGGQRIVTDVVAVGDIELQVNTGQARPLLPGYSIGSINDGPGTGTLGCFVERVDHPGVPLILSNSHVLARSGLAPDGAKIVQPGHHDGGGGGEAIGNLVQAFPFEFTDGYDNFCDAALAQLDAGQYPVLDIPGIGVPAYDPSVKPVVGMQVQKTGRTTGHTIGLVQDVNFRLKLPYPKPGGGKKNIGFAEQVLCSRYTDGGDSGALVCDMSGKAVGLHWSGSPSCSIFSPLTRVFDALRIRLATMDRDVPQLALDQFSDQLQELPGVQGVGVDATGLVVYVDDAASVTDDFPTQVTVVTLGGSEVSVPILVRVIGVITPE